MEDDLIYELVDEEIFEGNMTHAVAVLWWVLHLLGGKVVFPQDAQFWHDNFPRNTKLVLKKEQDQLVLCAETFEEEQDK